MSPPKVHYKIFILVILISVIFQAANTVSTAADLNIDITGCAAGILARIVLFSGEADTLAPTLLKLTDTGEAWYARDCRANS